MFPKSICLNRTVANSFCHCREKPDTKLCFQQTAVGPRGQTLRTWGKDLPVGTIRSFMNCVSLTFYNNFYVPMGLQFLTETVLTCRKTVNFNIFWKITTNTWRSSNKELPVVSSSASYPFKAKLLFFVVVVVKSFISAQETVMGSGM